VEAAQDTAKIAIGGRRRICCPRTTTLEAGTAKTAPNDRWKRVQRPNAGRRARNHLNGRLHEPEKGWCAGEEAWTPEVMVVRAGDDAEG